MIRRVSSTTVRPTSAAVLSRLIRADAAWRTSSWAARASVCSNSSALARAMAACVARVVMNATSPLVQSARLARDGGQRTEDPVVVDERRDQMAGDLERGVVRHRGVELIAANVGVGEDVPGAQDLADPALVASEDRQLPGQLVREAGPRRDLEGVVVQDPDRCGVGAEGPFRLVHDHPEQVGAIVRGGQATGDAEDGVESFGELGLERSARRRGCAREGPIGSAGHRHVCGREHHRHRAIGSGQPADEGPGPRDRRSVAVLGDRRHPAPGRGIELLDWARAHVSMVALRTSREVPPTVRVTRRTMVPGGPVRPVDPLTVRRWPDYTPAASRPRVATTVRSRIRGQHDPWTTVPVPSTAHQPSSPGTRAVPPPDG